MNRTLVCAGILAALGWMGASPAPAQTRNTLVITGYGTATYAGTLNADYPNDFSASVSPVMLYSAGGDVLFETELEFGLNGDATTTTLEYAQIDYMGFDNVQIVAGKFLLPFGVFGERLHPSWVNKLPTAPVLFGHAHGGVAEDALMPILSDAGLMLRWSQPLGTRWGLTFSGWVTQGPRVVNEAGPGEEGDGHAHVRIEPGIALSPGHADAGPEVGGVTAAAPVVGFGVAFGDNNKNKMIGGRLGIVRGPSFEAYVSGFHAMYDPANYLDYQGAALSMEWRRGTFELRGEGVLLRQEFEQTVGTSYPTLERNGYYLQASKRFGAWEPVMRFGRMSAPEIDGAVAGEAVTRLALGIDYWFHSSIPLKIAWEYQKNADDRLLAQWAFGF